jgi:hypothetical protein
MEVVVPTDAQNGLDCFGYRNLSPVKDLFGWLRRSL